MSGCYCDEEYGEPCEAFTKLEREAEVSKKFHLGLVRKSLDRIEELKSLLAEARREVEFWAPDESNVAQHQRKWLDRWFAVRDRIDAALKGSPTP